MSIPKFVNITKNIPFFPILHVFAPLKRCTRVHCSVLKNNPNYVNFFTRMISNFRYKWPPRDHAVKVVAVERRLDQGLVKGLVCARGQILILLVVIMASAVRNFLLIIYLYFLYLYKIFTYFAVTLTLVFLSIFPNIFSQGGVAIPLRIINTEGHIN